MSTLRVVSRARANGLFDVTKYCSSRTGLTLTIADVPSPLVYGSLCFATQTATNEGLPHTLEHLIFLGSEDFPHKGILDAFANRCLASGTNAGTDIDHTVYELSTAGSTGFLKLLPVYLDHLMYPLITDAHYTTEVHHVNGEGEDGGVVYCEMQSYEGTAERVVFWKLLEHVFPTPSAYGVESGGRIGAIRETLNVEKVRQYHKQYYCPSNLNVIVIGIVEHESVMDVVKKFEDKVEGKERYKVEAITILTNYLTDSSVSPLERDLIQIEKPFCSSIHVGILEQSVCLIYFEFGGTVVEMQDKMLDVTLNTMKNLAQGVESIDRKRLEDLIQMSIFEHQNKLEDSPLSTMSDLAIGDFLFSSSDDELPKRIDKIPELLELLKEPNEFWQSLLSAYFVDNEYVYVKSDPSEEYAKELVAAEKERISRQKSKFGEAGLHALKKKLEGAMADNEKSAHVPDSMLSDYTVRDLSGVVLVPNESTSNLEPDAGELGQMPPSCVMESSPKTKFVRISALLDTAQVPGPLRPLLSLYCDLLFECAVRRNGTDLLPYETVVKNLNGDLLSQQASLGVGTFDRFLEIQIKVPQEKYDLGVSWLHDVIHNIEFGADRIGVFAKKNIAAATEYKQDGHCMVDRLFNDITLSPTNNFIPSSVLRQEVYLTGLLKELEKDEHSVLKKLNDIKQHFSNKPDQVLIHLTANSQELNISQPWSRFTNTTKANIATAARTPLDPAHPGRARLLPLSSCDSSYVQHGTLTDVRGDHSDFAALRLFLQFLNRCEGPLWNRVRGEGLAYGVDVSISADTGLLVLDIYRSSDPGAAFVRSRDVIKSYMDGVNQLSESELHASKSSLVYEIVQAHATVSKAARRSLFYFLRGSDRRTYMRNLIDKIWSIDTANALEAGRAYLPALLDFKKCATAITCHKSASSSVAMAFTDMGCSIQETNLSHAELTTMP